MAEPATPASRSCFDLSPKKRPHPSSAREPQFRRERTAAGGLCAGAGSPGNYGSRLRHLLQAPSRRQLVRPVPTGSRGLTLLPGPGYRSGCYVWALLRRNRHDRRLPQPCFIMPLDKVGFPLCRRCRRTRPAAEHPFPRRREAWNGFSKCPRRRKTPPGSGGVSRKIPPKQGTRQTIV